MRFRTLASSSFFGQGIIIFILLVPLSKQVKYNSQFIFEILSQARFNIHGIIIINFDFLGERCLC